MGMPMVIQLRQNAQMIDFIGAGDGARTHDLYLGKSNKASVNLTLMGINKINLNWNM